MIRAAVGRGQVAEASPRTVTHASAGRLWRSSRRRAHTGRRPGRRDRAPPGVAPPPGRYSVPGGRGLAAGHPLQRPGHARRGALRFRVTPGAAWRTARTMPSRARRWLPGVLASPSASRPSPTAPGSGAVRGRRAAAPVRPAAGPGPGDGRGRCLALALAVVVAGARGTRALDLGHGLGWGPRAPPLGRRGLGAAPGRPGWSPPSRRALPRGDAGVGAGGRTGRPALQLLHLVLQHLVQRRAGGAARGVRAGEAGADPPPGRSGQIVFRLERPAESLVLLRPNFYNVPVDERSVVAGGRPFSNALEVSTDGGRSFRPVLVDTTVGDVLGGAVYDLTPYLGVSREYLLRFGATNTTEGEVTVLPSLMVSVVADPWRRPHPDFPLVVGAGGCRRGGVRGGAGGGAQEERGGAGRAGPGGAGAAGLSGGAGGVRRRAGGGQGGCCAPPAPATGLASSAGAGGGAGAAGDAGGAGWRPSWRWWAAGAWGGAGGRRRRVAWAGAGVCWWGWWRWRRAGRSWCGCATRCCSPTPRGTRRSPRSSP